MPTSQKSNPFFITIILIIAVIAITLTRNEIQSKKNKINNQSSEEAFVDHARYIKSADLHKKMLTKEDDSFIVDIRDRQSYVIKHIPNTVNIPIETLYQEYDKIEHKSKTLILIAYDYSQTSEISELYDFLTLEGFSDILVLSGGIYEWEKGYYPTISMGDPNSFMDQSKINYIEPVQLQIALKNNYSLIIVDTRSATKFNAGHIPGAINIPNNELEKRNDEIKKTKEVVVYGESELEDFQSAVKLYDLGFFATYILNGGLSKYIEKGFEITK